MSRTDSLSDLATSDLLYRCSSIRDALIEAGLFAPQPVSSSPTAPDEDSATASWRIGLEPLPLTREQMVFFEALGPQLLSFYKALNRLYTESAKGTTQPAWIADWLDQGKPEALIRYSRMKRFRDELPGVIRPDVIPTQDGMVITELDSVPGGIGLTACMSRLYTNQPAFSSGSDKAGTRLVGGPDGMLNGFAGMLRSHRGQQEGVVAIVVSDEAKDYRPEMGWLSKELTARGLETYRIEPREIRFTEGKLLLG